MLYLCGCWSTDRNLEIFELLSGGGGSSSCICSHCTPAPSSAPIPLTLLPETMQVVYVTQATEALTAVVFESQSLT